ncbi:hypothetical protein [Campylobacter hyointestinalis]|uniref:hypothetical protein n=1 Tax=Campylobacter hyointestinalis TaxID=198 RepID=UPI0025547AEB|nr:hypothetical protein [Campylobacter hyointestinalis]MDL2348367.1 hypothetical protein [Campylobacter hyointestinalis]
MKGFKLSLALASALMTIGGGVEPFSRRSCYNKRLCSCTKRYQVISNFNFWHSS